MLFLLKKITILKMAFAKNKNIYLFIYLKYFCILKNRMHFMVEFYLKVQALNR